MIYKTFFINDLRGITRDPLLLYVILIPFLIILMLRLLVPIVGDWMLEQYNLSIEAYYPLILSFFIILELPLVFGMVFGLLVLDERDDQVIMALRISPIPLKKYIGYRVVLAFTLSIAYILAFLPLSGLTARPITFQVLPVAVLAGLFSIIVLSLMGAFASNKVEGLALMKAMGILMLGPLAAYFIESKWQVLLGILPSYWPAKAFWLMYQDQPYLLYLLAGFIYEILLLYWLYRKFQIKLTRI